MGNVNSNVEKHIHSFLPQFSAYDIVKKEEQVLRIFLSKYTIIIKVDFMDNKKMLLCISLAVVTTIFTTSLNSWAQSRNSYQGQQGSQQTSQQTSPQQSKQDEQEQQLQKQIILQGNSQRQQVLDQLMLERQQLITKRVADQIVMNPTQAYALTRTAVTANPGISDAITAASIKAVPERAAAITQAAVETCVPGQAHAVVYSAILAGADPVTVTEAARRGGATSAQIKAGETRALQKLQQQQKKDTDSTAAKTKSGSAAGAYSASTPPSPLPPVPKSIPKENQ